MPAALGHPDLPNAFCGSVLEELRKVDTDVKKDERDTLCNKHITDIITRVTLHCIVTILTLFSHVTKNN